MGSQPGGGRFSLLFLEGLGVGMSGLTYAAVTQTVCDVKCELTLKVQNF